MMPLWIKIKVRNEKTRLGFWLPIFWLWPLFGIVILVISPLLLLAELIMSAMRKPLRIFCIMYSIRSLIISLRGLSIHIKGRDKQEVCVVVG